jgi:CRISPR-associated protein Cpf1
LKTSDTFNKDDLTAYIAYYQELTKDYFTSFTFNFKHPADYGSWVEFTDHCNEQGYSLKFERNISENYINQLVEEGKLYFFQIYSKDFSKSSTGTPNMHTLYWKALFDKENLKNVIYKLNGQAEIFFRKKSLNYNKEIWEKGHHYNDLKDKFKYPIIANKRYALDKLHFHCPITVNFKAIGKKQIDEMVNTYIKTHGIKYIIGIDRGERHLLYLSLIDLNGNIVKQFSLNKIANERNGVFFETNYHDLLDKKEGDRTLARKSWQTIETIKELKEGYLSQVIYRISEMMFYDGEDENGKIKKADYPTAIVVLEDLNAYFIRGRQKIEKQVYQKFEKMLIDKLNYLVDKKKEANENGGLLNAYQLTNKFTSFKDMDRQNGFLFYIPAWNTSKIDPITGFVNMFNTRYENLEKAKVFFEKFCDIRYNKTKNYFEFVVDDYTKFSAKVAGTQLKWTICTWGERIENFRNKENQQWDCREVILTDELEKLFVHYHVSLDGNLRQSIINQNEKEFFERLLHLFKLTLQMRNSIIKDSSLYKKKITHNNSDKIVRDMDYLISPIADHNGDFFDSRSNRKNLPDNADANGAYNIARKGLLMLKRIEESDEKKIDSLITNKAWLNFVQNKSNDSNNTDT